MTWNVLAHYSLTVISFEMRGYKIHFCYLHGTTFGLLDRLTASLYQLLRCFRDGKWAANKLSAALGLSLAISVPTLKTGGSNGAKFELTGGLVVGARGGVESPGRSRGLLHGSLPGLTGFAVTRFLLARDLGARGDVTSLIEGCRD